MITRSKQNWSIGSIVRVGFCTLRVVKITSIIDGLPDIYRLESLDRTKHYEFTPYNGLIRL